MSNNLHKLRTGDAIFFSSNNSTGFFLRTMISSIWNHSGIAIRIIKDPYPRLSLDYQGDLCFLETNTSPRRDFVTGDNTVGAAYSEATWVLKKYNKVAVRYLREDLRNDNLLNITESFVSRYRNTPFPSGIGAFLSAWLGISFSKNINSMFCSELMANYYREIWESNNQPMNLNDIFGQQAPEDESLFRPHDFSIEITPDSLILDQQEDIYHKPGDLIFVMLQPLLLTILVLFIIYILIISVKISN